MYRCEVWRSELHRFLKYDTIRYIYVRSKADDTARGATENAGVENAIRSKLQGRKMREWK